MIIERISNTTIYLAGGEQFTLPVPKQDPYRLLFVVRHAEKGQGWDAGLTQTGHQRALRLAALLEKAPITEVLTTELLRARQTAEPTARSHNLEVRIYHPFPAGHLLMNIHSRLDGGASLVVGHQNTVPALLNEAAGVYDYNDLEADEYDRFFIVICKQSGHSQILEFTYQNS